jgi:hypothetical protein
LSTITGKVLKIRSTSAMLLPEARMRFSCVERLVNDPAIPAAQDKPMVYLNWILLDN